MTEQSTAALDQAAAEAVESESQEVVEETKPEAEEVQETSAEENPLRMPMPKSFQKTIKNAQTLDARCLPFIDGWMR